MSNEIQGAIDNPTGIERRRPFWSSSLAALKYAGAIPRDRLRKADKISQVLVFCCGLFSLAFIVCTAFIWNSLPMLGLDLVIVAVTLFFIMQRLGILITLSPRQAALVWDMFVAIFVLGVLVCANALALIYYMTHIAAR